MRTDVPVGAAAAPQAAAPDKPLTPAQERQAAKQAKLQARREEVQKAAAELKARRRALGNIQFIGHLYRKRMLTEKIMHECIKKLLAEADNPKPEDLECLAKLLATVGLQLDNNPRPQNKTFMDAYFGRIHNLSKLQILDSRIRFMLMVRALVHVAMVCSS